MRFLILLFLVARVLSAQVAHEDLLRADETPGNWLTYSGNFQGHRYSGLDEVTTSNVDQLRLKWAFQRRFREKFETTPLVVDGIMYLTVPPNEAYALDAETGVVLWEYKRSLPPKIIVCCGQVNRGLAIQGDRLFMATLDAMVIALDRKTGRLLWESDMIDYRLGYAATHAPLVVKDKVIVGVAGGEYGIRGFIDAYNVEDGEREWRFYTVPGPRRIRQRHLGRRLLGDGRRFGLDHRFLRSRYEPDLLGYGQPGA